MSFEDEIFALEANFWLLGERFFLDHVDEQCLLAFPQMPQMHGVHARSQVAATAAAPNRWSGLQISNRNLLLPSRELAIISYRADAMRGNTKYSALVSSAYAKRESGWKLAFHQQSPLDGDI